MDSLDGDSRVRFPEVHWYNSVMFKDLSMTGVGALITLVELGLKAVNIELPEGTTASLVNGIIAVVGAIFLIIGQVRRKDLKAGLVRKSSR